MEFSWIFLISLKRRQNFTSIFNIKTFSYHPTATSATHPRNQTPKTKTHNPKTILTLTKRQRCLTLKRDPIGNFRSERATTFSFIIRYQTIGGERASMERLDSLLISLFRWRSSEFLWKIPRTFYQNLSSIFPGAKSAAATKAWISTWSHQALKSPCESDHTVSAPTVSRPAFCPQWPPRIFVISTTLSWTRSKMCLVSNFLLFTGHASR